MRLRLPRLACPVASVCKHNATQEMDLEKHRIGLGLREQKPFIHGMCKTYTKPPWVTAKQMDCLVLGFGCGKPKCATGDVYVRNYTGEQQASFVSDIQSTYKITLTRASWCALFSPLWFCLSNMHFQVRCTCCLWLKVPGIRVPKKSSLVKTCSLLVPKGTHWYNLHTKSGYKNLCVVHAKHIQSYTGWS